MESPFKEPKKRGIDLKILFYIVLFILFLYTLGFAVSLWKEKQKMGALGTLILCLLLIVLPFFSMYK